MYWVSGRQMIFPVDEDAESALLTADEQQQVQTTNQARKSLEHLNFRFWSNRVGREMWMPSNLNRSRRWYSHTDSPESWSARRRWTLWSPAINGRLLFCCYRCGECHQDGRHTQTVVRNQKAGANREPKQINQSLDGEEINCSLQDWNTQTAFQLSSIISNNNKINSN